MGEAVDGIFLWDGLKGFHTLLGDLAEHLDTLLLIVDLFREPNGLGQAKAEAWVVQPGAEPVKHSEVAL